jgi:23S rRNA (cytosine1962-C5)-methyltransferase
MTNKDLVVRGWRDYELIDSGDNRKLERFGKYTLIRPETQALWLPRRPDEWKRAAGEFRFDGGKGAWYPGPGLGAEGHPRGGAKGNALPEGWELAWNEARFTMRLTGFKHVGVFPEQAANWAWIGERVSQIGAGHHRPIVLNLFGYTGVASIVAARAGAEVTHVDASRQSNEWAKGNARLSEVPVEAGSGSSSSGEGGIRYLFDDALKFVEREVRRGAGYDGIILDPPAFGRGAKGEVWKIDEKLPRLLEALAKLLNRTPGAFFLLNGYAAGYSPHSFAQATESAFPEIAKLATAEFGELQIAESDPASGRSVPSGVYVRFVR